MSEKEKRCMGCMNPLPEGRNQCGICGYPSDGENDAAYIRAHTVLSERYTVGRLLEYTGDAAVYLGYDMVLKSTIRIREFYPKTLCERTNSGTLRVIPGCETVYSEYLEKFRVHARALARLRELSMIEAVYDIFDANHTAFTVSEYCEGNSLETRLAQTGGRMRWDEARPLFMPLMATLSSLHRAGVFHLGICPKNLIIATDGKLHLQGFCMPESRQAGGDLSPNLIAGYSAPEQYKFGEETGALTDVYGLSATIFRVLTGNPPPDGPRRSPDSTDLLVPTDVASELPDYVAAALFKGLQVIPDKRLQSVQAMHEKLATAPAVSALLDDGEDGQDSEKESVVEKKSSRKRTTLLFILVIIVILLIFFGILFVMMNRDFFGGSESSGPVSEDEPSFTHAATTKKPDPTATLYATTNVVGWNYYEKKDTNLTGRMTMEIEYLAYSNKPKGTILSQTPSAETPAEGETVIKVIISNGPQQVQVPSDLRGWTQSSAQRLLEAIGFTVTVVEVTDDSIDKGFVVDVEQAGRKLDVGSEVTLRISATSQTTEPPATEAPDPEWPFY